MVSGRAAVAADRLTALDERLNELAQRLLRIAAGERSSAADVRRARARASQQRARAAEAETLLVRSRRDRPHRSPPPARRQDGQDGQVGGPEVGDPQVGDPEVEPVRRTTCPSRIGAVPTTPTAERYWRVVADQARRANWHNWTEALCVAAVALLPSVRGVAVSAFADQLPCPMGASDRRTSRIEALQQILGEGPAVTAQLNHRPVTARMGQPNSVQPNDVQPDRADWLGWAAAVRGSGVRAVWSFAHRWPGIGCAAMTFYRATDADAPGERAEAQALSRLAGRALQLDLERDNSAGLDALHAIHVAAGVLAERLGLSAADALARIRAHAFVNDLELVDVAAWVVSDGARLD